MKDALRDMKNEKITLIYFSNIIGDFLDDIYIKDKDKVLTDNIIGIFSKLAKNDKPMTEY